MTDGLVVIPCSERGSLKEVFLEKAVSKLEMWGDLGDQ
jgi:hypothetical protein